ncbi:acyl-CoA reductase [Chitinimonas sp. BJB300]|uniref:acyl-CoA reductase n=1 Tax=Chitinimonas sp. BJB300 TaxID=1559339 RepID=UPI000C0D3C63|nr:acyl-CoA reductase [Chitinimonas sp. BJB300]PHV13078.1 long-chain-fatty-acyl-CoA reductase [Chitinimonas sp. BJB300]TSJ87712.1 AMP-binding protein [Chitinimonas sp. BJB300]
MYLAHGTLMAQTGADNVLASLQTRLPTTLAQRLDSDTVLACAESFAQWVLNDPDALELDAESRTALHSFCRRDALMTKLARELGETPFSLRRIDYRSPHFESWRPLGLVVHITPANSALLPFFAMLESLLVGNINWLRPSSSDNGRTAALLAAFLRHDSTGTLADYLAVLPWPNADLTRLFSLADAVSAWGGDTALTAIRRQLPAGCRWIDWGHRISFAYVVPNAASEAQLDAVADEVCRLDQQACSSPQCVLVDSEDPAVLRKVGDQLAEALARRARQWPGLTPSEQESAEISTQLAFARLDQSFSDVPGHVWQGVGWRIIWAQAAALVASPLFRTVQLRPVPRAQLVGTLQPWRTRLQTCGLVAHDNDLAQLGQMLLAAGVSRVTSAGAMHDGYEGEPHDGVYALARLTRRVSVSLAADTLPNHVTLDQPPAEPEDLVAHPIMDKVAFQQTPMTADAQLFFRSGGSSGKPKLAGFSYRDYHRQMQAAADGLFAAGLDPANDRVMNLLYGGNLYGGLLSFFTILDKLSAVHFPMGGPSDDDYSEIAQLIVNQRINTLIGMPGTIHRLFVREETRLRTYGGVQKIMLGGEHLNPQQREFLAGFGVSMIRSAIYGSVDAGPLGHACGDSPDGVFHLLADTQWLEIVDAEQDQPAEPGVAGRLLFTSRAREGQAVTRYDLGDLGRWVTGPCECGLPAPRFELCGRHGQLLRVGTVFFNPALNAEAFGVPVQFLIDNTASGKERLVVQAEGDVEHVRQHLSQCSELVEALKTQLLELEVIHKLSTDFQRHPQSGKTPLVLDMRRLVSTNTAEPAGAA